MKRGKNGRNGWGRNPSPKLFSRVRVCVRESRARVRESRIRIHLREEFLK